MKFRRQKIDVTKLPPVIRLKWGDNLLDEGFVPFPKRLLRCGTRLFKGNRRMSELCAMLAIIDYRRPAEIRPPSLAYLSFLAGVSEKRFRACLGKFQKLGWVEISGNEDRMNVNYAGFWSAVEAATKEVG